MKKMINRFFFQISNYAFAIGSYLKFQPNYNKPESSFSIDSKKNRWSYPKKPVVMLNRPHPYILKGKISVLNDDGDSTRL